MHIRTNPRLNKIFRPVIKFCEWLGVHHPILLARIRYYARFKKPLHLKNPQTLNEKILFLSLKTDTTLWTRCADKYEVRDYVKECGLEEILIPLIGVWNHATDIDFGKLPDEFVLKATHGSGDVLVVTDKNKINIPQAVKMFEKDLSQQYGALESGHHYMRINPRMIAEELLHCDFQTQGNTLVDYKIWCFNGKAKYYFTCSNRTETTVDIMVYDMDWNPHPECCKFEEDHHYGSLVPKPQNLSRMKEIAEILAKPFPCVRIDLYNIDGKIYFGELTFTSYGGMMGYFSNEFQLLAGSQIDLTEVKVVK